MIKGISHIGIAISDIDKSLGAICKVLDMPTPAVHNNPEKKMKFALLDLGGVGLEFLQDCDQEGPFARFVKEKGDAIHHFCLLTDDIEADIESLKLRGIEMADQKPKIGLRGKKIAFTRPSALNGIPIELSEP
ncbi:MAG: VOC family protein [Pseudomonadota bacterium]